MRCPRCGCLHAENDRLCLRCGASLVQRTAVARPPGIDRTFDVIKRDPAEIEKPSVTSSAAAPGRPAAPARYGGFWRRFWACMLDGIVLGFASMLVYGAGIAVVGFLSPGIEDPAKTLLIPQLVANMLIKAFYFIYFHALTGQTVGKLALGLKVVKREGDPIGFGRATVRYFGSFISLLFAGLGFAWIAFDARKQGWHDKMAGSFVVRV
jgi:uncharacterized RDD family membrane protein YckC